ncbi:ribosomal protein S18-alanine N-acetyltransferase [Venenivibrio stagnispumantis]|uniref:[Ribosomal protein bS18]-alanine N-acetyltransferase n=1 Tax=Venenivibrio stagnispumantis TaxID=407998 RepID=A0AA45WN09_9AQUI|nr:ribosomal protein S18-alanine N-acetyltransferase [Venenivibrio stagnispumantis]MCW4573715.1 ribosomal protein S18-alanine N-acetyltransferase [Venenivibrio stagnispumantis]SMP16039.1 ribosomal-protein-alanine N-acetyltransferase [Venenivibrio stagnispumantis]
MIIEDLTEKDIEPVKQIIKEALNRDYQFSKNAIKKILKIKDKIVAVFELNIIFDTAEILIISVKPEYQQKGIGKEIMNYIINFCKSNNVKYIYLEVAENNQKAINLYKKFGFEVYNIRKDYYENNINALLMKKEIICKI